VRHSPFAWFHALSVTEHSAALRNSAHCEAWRISPRKEGRW